MSGLCGWMGHGASVTENMQLVRQMAARLPVLMAAMLRQLLEETAPLRLQPAAIADIFIKGWAFRRAMGAAPLS